MKTRTAFLTLSLLLQQGILFPSALAEQPSRAPEVPETSSGRLSWWRDARFGLFIHWGPASLTGREISWSRKAYGAEKYDALYKSFNPVKFNADEWVATARKAGMRYIVLTAKHHDGFLLWNSNTTDYNIMNTPFGRDVVKELAKACEAAGMPFCVYFSPGDWKDPDCRDPQNNPRFVQRMHAQLTELLGQYGKIPLVWIDFDGFACPSSPAETAALIRTLQPNAIINNRLEALHPDESHGRVGSFGDYATPEQRLGSFCDTTPWECCMTIARQWSYKPADEAKSLKQCLQILVNTVGGDGNLLLNVGPMPTGEFDPAHAARLLEIGEWMTRNGEAIHGTRGGPYSPTGEYSATRRGDMIYLHVPLPAPRTLRLPAVAAQLKAATLPGGQALVFRQTARELAIELPETLPEREMLVIRLQAAHSVMELPVIHPFSKSGSLAYQAEARASSSVAPLFMHTAGAVLDDNDDTYWTPGRDPRVNAELEMKNFRQNLYAPESLLWLRSGWVELSLPKAARPARALIKEKLNPRNYRPVESWKIEYNTAQGWKTAAEGTSIGNQLSVILSMTSKSSQFRLSVTASGRPAIAEFQLFEQP